MEWIRELTLKEENIRKWVMPLDKQRPDYGQNLWVNKVMKVAIMMGNTEGFFIKFTLEGVPNMLKDHLSC